MAFAQRSGSLSLLSSMNSLSLAQVRDPIHAPPRLPVEVIEEVIDQACDDPRTLRQLTLICKPLLTRARIHLFVSIVIRDVEQMVSSREFLDSHPWVLPLVQKVTFSVDTPWRDEKPNIPVLDMIPSNFLTRLPNLNAWEMNASESVRLPKKARLSLHRSLLLCYQAHSHRIKELELAYIIIQDVSHFVRLVSAFTALRRLTCSDLQLPKEHQTSLPPNSAILDKPTKPLKIQHMSITTSIHICLVEYLLSSSAATLCSLSITLKELGYIGNYIENKETYFERLEDSMDRLSMLSSMVLVIPIGYYGMFTDVWGYADTSQPAVEYVQRATRILDHVRRARRPPTDVQVRFHLRAFAELGCRLSSGAGRGCITLEARQSLEASLLAFPEEVTYNVQFYEEPEGSGPSSMRRAGRAEFWSPTITSAFPNLNQRGLLMFPRSNSLDLFGHESEVRCLFASPDNKWFASASKDGTIIVWDAEHRQIIHEWLAHHGPVNALAISPDNRKIISAGGQSDDGDSKTLIVWDVSDGVNKVAALVASISMDSEKLQWEMAVAACTWSPDGTLIASQREDAVVCVWDAFTFQQLSATDPVYAGSFAARSPGWLQWSPDSRYLVWCYAGDSEDFGRCSELAVWDPFRGRPPKQFPSHQLETRLRRFDVRGLSFDPQGKRIAITVAVKRDGGRISDRQSGYVVVWDIMMNGTTLVIPGDNIVMRAVSFSPDGQSLSLVSKDGSMKIWDTESCQETASLEGNGGNYSEACFSPDGKYIAAVSHIYKTQTSTVQLWRVGEASCAAVFTEHKHSIKQLAFSPNGEFLASGDWEGIVHIRRLSQFIGH